MMYSNENRNNDVNAAETVTGESASSDSITHLFDVKVLRPADVLGQSLQARPSSYYWWTDGN